MTDPVPFKVGAIQEDKWCSFLSSTSRGTHRQYGMQDEVIKAARVLEQREDNNRYEEWTGGGGDRH